MGLVGDKHIGFYEGPHHGVLIFGYLYELMRLVDVCRVLGKD